MEAGRADAPRRAAARRRRQFDALALSSSRACPTAIRVIAWNAPGYILSDAFKTDWPNCQTFADALTDFLAALKLDRVNIVGNSFGSRVAQCFAIHYPGRVIKLAMTGTGIGRRA